MIGLYLRINITFFKQFHNGSFKRGGNRSQEMLPINNTKNRIIKIMKQSLKTLAGIGSDRQVVREQ